MSKKKILITSYNLDIGGVEKALVNMVNNIDFKKYDVTLLLQHKKGAFLEDVKKEVKIEGFNLSECKFTFLRKVINLLKIIITIIKNKNKYDFSACFGTGYKASSIVALYASKNNATWMHTNIINFIKNQNKNDSDEIINKKVDLFLSRIKFRSFKNYLFVSENARNAFLSLYPEDEPKCHLCYNFVDYKSILKKSKEKIKEKKLKNQINLVNISRHTEFDKRISRIINAVFELKDNYNIVLHLIGDGKDQKEYIELVREKKLEEYVIFHGAKSNPYPYYLLGDMFVLSSAFEGFPTVYTEALTLDIPIVTTDVSDAQTFIKNRYGVVCKNDDNSLASAIEKMIKQGFSMKEKFIPEEFNKQSMNVIEGLIDND